jgi:hypothetical protein
MKRDREDNLPLAEQTARGLGVRTGVDIPVDGFGLVEPGAGGMSVALDDPSALPAHRRPPEFGGDGDDPLWRIEESDLAGPLTCVPDELLPGHAFVEPAYQMPLEDYQVALAETRQQWRLC